MSDSTPETLATKPRWETLRRKTVDGSAPVFSVRHFLLTIGFAAVHLAIMRVIATDAAPLENSPASALMMLVCQSMLLGLAYTGATLVVVRLLGRADWRIEPGHWLLAAIGCAAAAETAAEFLNHLAPGRDILAAMSIHITVLGLALTPPLLSRASPTIWKLAIALILVVVWGRVWFMTLWPGWNLLTPIITLLLLTLAAALDGDRAERGWFHWAGIGVWIIAMLMRSIA